MQSRPDGSPCVRSMRNTLHRTLNLLWTSWKTEGTEQQDGPRLQRCGRRAAVETPAGKSPASHAGPAAGRNALR